MKRLQPRNLRLRPIRQLLRQGATVPAAGARIEMLSQGFLGRPYVANPLIGSAQMKEVFTASIDGFDCITYVETILALARSSKVDEFVEWLRRIRYENGQVEWRRRNHYMTSWIRNNTRIGVVREIAATAGFITKNRILNVVPELPPARARFRCIPKRFMPRLAAKLRSGDLIFFASTRSHLDIFHCGIIVRQPGGLFIRHAARSRQAVVDQELPEFLKNNRMAGVVVVRPT